MVCDFVFNFLFDLFLCRNLNLEINKQYNYFFPTLLCTESVLLLKKKQSLVYVRRDAQKIVIAPLKKVSLSDFFLLLVSAALRSRGGMAWYCFFQLSYAAFQFHLGIKKITIFFSVELIFK